jgi:hypothetical protein
MRKCYSPSQLHHYCQSGLGFQRVLIWLVSKVLGQFLPSNLPNGSFGAALSQTVDSGRHTYPRITGSDSIGAGIKAAGSGRVPTTAVVGHKVSHKGHIPAIASNKLQWQLLR